MYNYKVLTNEDEIKKVLFNPEIWNRISEDEQCQDEIEVLNDNNQWAGLYFNHVLFGVGLVHRHNQTTGTCHIHILKEHRDEHAGAGGMLSIQAALNETEYDKFRTEVPEIYKDVQYFLKKLGFRPKGYSTVTFKKNNKEIKQIIFKTTRKELEV